MRTFTVAPSEFAWLLDQCPKCYWRKARGLQPPREAVPAVFGAIDLGMKAGVTLETVQKLGIPAVRAATGKEFLVAAPFVHGNATAIVRGKRDVAFYAEDGSLIIIDFKTGRAEPKHIFRYGRQMHSYDYAYMNPAQGNPQQVSGLWVVTFDVYGEGTSRFNAKELPSGGIGAALVGGLFATEIKIDREKFLATLREVCDLVSSEEPPPSSSSCAFCAIVEETAKKEWGLVK